jgi:tripartite-type tricarboxylate transporter receptor subunit TctC
MMLTKRALLAGMAATGFGLAAARPASAQTYPTRPVKMIVPLPAGSAPDVRHRFIAQALTQLWGQQVIVENRPGGGGIIGTRAALGEQPDGYTLLAALASIYMILPAQQRTFLSTSTET